MTELQKSEFIRKLYQLLANARMVEYSSFNKDIERMERYNQNERDLIEEIIALATGNGESK